MTNDNWYNLNLVEVLQRLETEAGVGLDAAEVERRLASYGPNELSAKNRQSPWQILWEQLTATVVVVLIVAAVISAILGEYQDAIAILAIVCFNALLGFRQEYQAERAIAALKKLAVPTVKVRRQGQVEQISARQLVPGDIVFLEAGNLVPADCRLLEAVNLRISEASLTGESEPTDKLAKDFTPQNPENLASQLQISNSSPNSPTPQPPLSLADRQNMAYMGTTITYGRALAVVTQTGMNTELGQIAQAIESIDREATPLQKRLDQLGWVLAIAILILVLVIFGLGLLRGEPIKLMFLMAVSLAVAAIPEGLPAVVTIALALGAARMLKQQALIRKLPAVETLGALTTICADKTGTLTQNRMSVTCLDTMGHQMDLASSQGHLALNPREFIPQYQPSPVGLLLTGAALCNDALLRSDPHQPDHFQAIGDPTETALVVAAANWGLVKTELAATFPRMAELPFNAERKRMTTLHQLPTLTNKIIPQLDWIEQWQLIFPDAPYIALTKGAVETLLPVCTQVWLDGKLTPLTNFWHQLISDRNDELAGKGIRVLGVAVRPLAQQFLADLPAQQLGDIIEQNLVFVGIIGMIDPPRPEVQEAVLICQQAGIRPVMITGDHPLTALHIATELGIDTSGNILTGQDLEKYSTQELENLVAKVSVYARVSPQHKLEIVRALQNCGQIVAMTGDGVNDAPALKKADIGVAMGITGTDVAKEAADMVLLDDNFATIVAATQEGRVIYDNVRKFIKYTLTGNCGELWVIILAPFWGMPLPLLPLQILWINLLADGLLALALGVEPAEPNIMSRLPHHPQESVFSRGVGRDIIWIGLLLGMVLLGVDYQYWSVGSPSWQTMVFSTLVFARMGLAQSMRSEKESIFRMSWLANLPLLAALILTFILQLGVVYLPFLQAIFKTTALSLSELGISLLLSSVVIWAMELDKWRQLTVDS